jgi:hypothetical protein
MLMENDVVKAFNTFMSMPGISERVKTDFKISQENELILTYLDLRLKFLEDSFKRETESKGSLKALLKNGIKEKCKSSLSKTELAQLFYILMDEGILFFDPVEKVKNRSMMQEFVTGNFTYYGDAGHQVSMESVSKQFSESKGYTYREKQLCFLNELILVIQKRKERVMQW